MNGIRPMLNSIHYGVPTIDGDFMGRAYPRLYILTPFRKSLAPSSLVPSSAVWSLLEESC